MAQVTMIVNGRAASGTVEGRTLLSSFLKDNPKPSEQEIRVHLEGNICRCTGYHNIIKAIYAASGQDVAALGAD